MVNRDFGEDENKLISLIYESALHPSRWKKTLLYLREITRAKDCNLIFHDRRNRLRNDLFTSTVTDKVRNEYLTQYIDADMKWGVQLSAAATGDVICTSKAPELLGHARENMQDNALLMWYQNTLQYGDQAACYLMGNNYSTGILSVNRAIDQHFFESSVVELLQRITPHAQRAVRIHHQLISARENYSKLSDTLEKTAAGLTLLDHNYYIVIVNEEAARILSYHPSLRIGTNGRLEATCKTADMALQKLIEHALNAKNKPSVLQKIEPAISLPHAERLHPLKLSAVPLRSSNLDCTAENSHAAIAVFMTDPERRWNVSKDYLHHAYELTPAECSVAQVLVNTGNIRDIAEQRGTTESTARWQLKRIMEKTATHSQAELMRVLIKLSDDFSVPVA